MIRVRRNCTWSLLVLTSPFPIIINPRPPIPHPHPSRQGGQARQTGQAGPSPAPLTSSNSGRRGAMKPTNHLYVPPPPTQSLLSHCSPPHHTFSPCPPTSKSPSPPKLSSGVVF
ncbi:hypothetical protein E2C01_096293 [Portunus trituberculatus]|uniref:Uncharacterized protein n=1 Tax=Portunus trituberculatus TaxID=210409 RepID=A0A5B7JXK8_PORTR|nr:hypothetical protein [Portunus trituberculatus]